MLDSTNSMDKQVVAIIIIIVVVVVVAVVVIVGILIGVLGARSAKWIVSSVLFACQRRDEMCWSH